MKITSLPESFELYFPEKDNDGIPLPEENALIIAEFLNRWGGVSVQGGITGYWKGYFDSHSVMSVSSDLIPQTAVEEVLQKCFDLTDQEAFFFKRNGVSFIAER